VGERRLAEWGERSKEHLNVGSLVRDQAPTAILTGYLSWSLEVLTDRW
jgi:hypothetical protein